MLAKDARLLARNRALLVALLAYPFLLALVLGAAFQEPPSTLDLVVVDDDANARVRVLGDNMTTQDLMAAAREFARIRMAPSVDAALTTLREGGADAALHIPRGFLVNLSTLGTNATMSLYVDESDPVRAGVAENAVEGAVDAFVEQIIRNKIGEIALLIQTVIDGGEVTVAFTTTDVIGTRAAIQLMYEVEAQLPPESAERAKIAEARTFLVTAQLALGGANSFVESTALPLQLQTSGLAGEDTGLAAIALPGAIVLAVFWTGALAAALLAARERETGVARRLKASPAPAWMQWTSKALVALSAALLPAAVLVLLGIAFLDAPPAEPGLVALVLVASSLAAASLGALCAAVARATSGAALLAVLLLLPMLLLGGLFYPVAYMPAAARAVASALPVTLATDATRGALLRGSDIELLAVPVAGLVAFAAVAAGLGAWASRRAG